MRSAPIPLPFAAFAVAALDAAEAHAEPHQVCLYLDLGADLWDASPRAADGKDFREEHGRNEGPTSYPAQRWLVQIRDESAGQIVFGWDPLDAHGCASFELAGGDTELRVEWVRWAVWNADVETGNQLVGYYCAPGMESCRIDFHRRVVPANMPTGVTTVIEAALDLDPVDAVMWAASFAEERFASRGEQPLDGTRLYVSHDPADVLPGATQADRTFGNQPSLVVDGEAWHSKFTIAHELGHLQTIMAPHPAFGRTELDYCYDPSAYPMAPSCTPNHTMESHEWQAVAAVEGMASWYAVATWNDVDIVECQNCEAGVRYVTPTSPDDARTYIVPREQPLCTAQDAPQCPAGVGNEWDWLSALRLFRLHAPTTPSFRTMFQMLTATYATGSWPPRSTDDSFWTSVDQAMAAHLGPNHAAWQAAAMTMELDR